MREKTKQQWNDRVKAWRASGLTAPKFCKGKPFTSGALRVWAHKLRGLETAAPPPHGPALRLARVVRMPFSRMDPAVPPVAYAASEAPGAPQDRELAPVLVVELPEARISVPPGFDPRTLAAVLAVLEQHRALRRAP